jgi:general secretion pathway protein G
MDGEDLPPENERMNNQHRRRWVLPLCVVLVIIVALVLVGIVGHVSRLLNEQEETVAVISEIKTALEVFKKDNGSYPNGLNDLVTKPTNASAHWHHYMDKVPLDPWKNPFIFAFPGKHNTNGYDLSSAGPDGKFGTADDIVNR